MGDDAAAAIAILNQRLGTVSADMGALVKEVRRLNEFLESRGWYLMEGEPDGRGQEGTSGSEAV
jgi:hypothetical protein